MSNLRDYSNNVVNDLFLAQKSADFDAVVVGGDHHAIALGSLVANIMDKPLMIVCIADHECVDAHITCIGDVDPRMRFLYVDDFYSFGATKKRTFDYMNSSEEANIVATYSVIKREYERI
jgi:orotate phosphoribosyltransferase-like protein